MEKLVLIGIGIAALGYVGYVIWKSVKGKPTCSCGDCPTAGSCCSKPDSDPDSSHK